MPLTDKRATLKGYLTRFETQRDDLERGGELSDEDIEVILHRLNDYERQFIAIHDHLIAGQSDHQGEDIEHEFTLSRVRGLKIFFQSQLNKDDDDHEALHVQPAGAWANIKSKPNPQPTTSNISLGSQPNQTMSAIELALAKLIEHQAAAETRNQALFQMLNQSILQSNRTTQSPEPPPHHSKLPTLSVPTFSGDPTSWTNFRDMFLSIVHNNARLSNVQRLQYLMSYVSGNAHKMISTLELTDANYTVAWQTLSDEYEDSDTMVHCHIDKFYAIPKLTTATVSSFTELYATASSVLNSLDAIRVTSRDPWVIYLLLSKLDHETKVLWSREPGNAAPTLVDFMAFLGARLKSLKKCQDRTSELLDSQKSMSKSTTKSNTVTVLATPATNACPACHQNDHKIFRCPSFIDKTPADRLAIIRKNDLCRKCLVANHKTIDCTFYTCKKCKRHHNSLLHEAFYPDGASNSNSQTNPQSNPSLSGSDQTSTVSVITQAQSEQVIPAPQPNANPNPQLTTPPAGSLAVLSSTTAANPPKRVFLETAVVHVLDKFGVPIQCRAILDSGAQVNLMSQTLFQRLKLPKTPSSLFIGGVTEGGARAKYQTDCNMQSLNQRAHFSLTCHVVSSVLQQKLPNWECNPESLDIPKNLPLADPTWHVSQPIDLLISNELYNDIVESKIVRLGPGLPVLKESALGWIISGPYAEKSVLSPTACIATTLASIDSTLKRFWEIEEVSHPVSSSRDHDKVEEIFKDTTYRDPAGRYVVKVPFAPSISRLQNNLPNATRQLLSLERRLEGKPELKLKYHQAMKENFDSNFFEVVPQEDLDRPSYYMPHHCVLKLTDQTTKVRVVMNASSKSQSGLSLNDVAMQGPVVQPDIITILLRFRQYQFAFTCDIKKMYPQVLIHESHRDFHRILWRFDASQPIIHYRARGVCFGVSSSPFMATRALLALAEEVRRTHPLATQLLQKCFYVDDCLASYPTLEQSQEAIRQLDEVLQSAGMSLAKWKANKSSILPSQTASSSDVIFDPSSGSTLGMIWRPVQDQFAYRLGELSCPETKRGLLSLLASIYDPLGLIGPVVVQGKLIIQSAWKLNVNWDDQLPESLSKEWMQFHKALPHLHDISIPRWISSLPQSEITEIHVFTDSSSYAYGAVAYAITGKGEGKNVSHILIAKSKVAPIETPTIPRLELLAAHLGARLLEKIRNAIPTPSYHLWSDSTIILGQIRSQKTKLESFVLTKVNEIQSLTDVTRWHYVPTHLNPADIISRGMNPAQLKTSSMWWNGPEYILQSHENWPKDPSGMVSDRSLAATQVVKPVSIHPINHILSKSNRFQTVLRILAYVLRFIARNRIKGPILPSEIDLAERVLISFVQNQCFSEVKSAIKTGLLHSSRRFRHLRSLNPFIDKFDVIRVGGRLTASTLEYDQRHPILLPKGHLALIIAVQAHKDHLHPGPQLLLATLRQKYWPLGARNLTRRVVKTCITCFRHLPTLRSQQMGSLPVERLKLASPFSACAVDFCGPILTRPAYKRGGVAYKTYICAFVCFATKAVHLEVVGDLTTDCFIAALRRFVSRRSSPAHIYCDNATNFRGAKVALKKLFDDLNSNQQPQAECTLKGINFHFIPPRSPHHGGLHEAAIKSLKHHLSRELGDTVLTFEELSTITSQIEAILNSRPITPLPDDPSEPAALTPGHFLVGKPLTVLPSYNYTNVPSNTLSRWQLCQRLLQQFSLRWKREYLHTLQKRSKWTEEKENLRVGDLVLLCEDTLSSFHWPMGVITMVHPGQDTRCRVVTVRTTKGTYTRAIQRIAKLPIEELPPSLPPPEHVDEISPTKSN